MRGQRLLIVTLGVAILVSCCSSIGPNSTQASPKGPKDGKANKARLRERLSEMAKEFGATSFEETSEEMSSKEESSSPPSLAPKQHVKRLVSAERRVELQEYQGVMGRPGVDFPVLPSIPKTGFSCRQVKSSGYYADLDTDCQVFHICADGRKISFLCPNGTIFRQSHLICDWWWTVDCASSREHYEESAEMLANDRKIYQARSDALSKSRGRQRTNRKPGVIREFEGASTSVTSFSTESYPRIARIEAHSKVINPSKHFPSSTAKPNQNAFSRRPDEFQASGSMEHAEQRQFHAFHHPFPDTRTRRPITSQLTEMRETSQSRQHLETKSSIHNIPQLRNFKQNTPPTPRTLEQRQFTPSKEFLDIQPSLRSTPLTRQPFVTTHRPQSYLLANDRDFEQNIPNRQFSQGRQTSQSRYTTTQQVQSPQNLRTSNPHEQKNQHQPQFRPEPQVFSQNKDDNNGTKTYSHFRTYSSSDGERQLPAETGSFVSNRGNQLLKQTTQKPNKQHITPIPQNRFPQPSNKTYVELDRSRTTTPEPTEKPLKVTLSQRLKPIIVQDTDHGLTEFSNKDGSVTEDTTPDEDEGDDGFPEPPSEEQFKDEDLFYLRNTTEGITEEIEGSTENPLKQEQEEEIDLESELGLSKPPNDVQFKEEDFGGIHRASKQIISEHVTSIPERSTAQSVREGISSNSNISSVEISRFHTPTSPTFASSSSTIESEIVPQIFISSTLEPPAWRDFGDEDAVIIKESQKIPNKPLTLDEEESDDEFHTTTFPSTTEEIKTEKENRKTSASSLSIVSSTTILPPEESTRRKVTPIFLEIISHGSSEQPVLKTFTVEELEKKHEMTESSIPTKKNNSESRISGPETRTNERFKSQIIKTLSTTTPDLSTTSNTESPTSPVLWSTRVHPTKQDINITTASPHVVKTTKSTTSIPPTTLYFTLSRRVQPPVLILSSTDPREQSKLKTQEMTFKAKESFGTRTKIATEGTTTATISKRVQPPVAEITSSIMPTNITSSTTVKSRVNGREPSESSISVQTVTVSSPQALNIEIDQLPTDDDDDLFNVTQSSISASSFPKKSTSYVEIQKHKTFTTTSVQDLTTTAKPSATKIMFTRKPETKTEPIESYNSSNESIKMEKLIKETITVDPEIPQALPFKHEPTPSPQFGNRDGLEIPVSSGPSTLHSLAVYFATKESQTETISPVFDRSTPFDSKKDGEKDKTTTASTPLTSSTPDLELTTEETSISPDNGKDTSIASLGFLTQSTRDSYSSLFPNIKAQNSSTSEQPETSTTKSAQKTSVRVMSTYRNTSDSSHDIIKTKLLDKLAEISLMESTRAREGKSILERTVQHTDSDDLLQGTDSRDLRELAQIFSRALSAYLEDPEEFKKVLNEVRPKEPLVTNISRTSHEIQQQSPTAQPFTSSSLGISISSTDYSSSGQEDEDEVLDFSDVYKVSHKKTASTTPLSQPLKLIKTKKRVSTSTATSSPITTISTTAASQYKDIDATELTPPEERLENAQTNYYSTSRQVVGQRISSNDTEIQLALTTSNPAKETAAEYTLPPGTQQYTGPGYGFQLGEGNFGPTAGGVNDPSRPRYGGFQNNSKLLKTPEETEIEAKIDRILDTKAIIEATTLNPGSRTHGRPTSRPKTAKTSSGSNSEYRAKEVTDKIGVILNTFAPEDVNNLAVVSDMPETENYEKDSKKTNSTEITDEALIGAHSASFSSSRNSLSANHVKFNRKWDNGAEIIDPFAINRELSASEEIILTVSTPRNQKGKTGSSITIPASNTEITSSSELSTLTSTTSSVKQSAFNIKSTKSTEETKQIEVNEDKLDSEKELQPSVIPDITFYSEIIKVPPPPSDSLIKTSSRNSNNLSSLLSTAEDLNSNSETSTEITTTVISILTNNSSRAGERSNTGTVPIIPIKSSSPHKLDSKRDPSVDEQNIMNSKLTTKSTEISTVIAEEDSEETTTQYRLSTPMPFTETTTESRETGIVSQLNISTTVSSPIKTTIRNLASPSTRSRTEKTTETLSFVKDGIEILKKSPNKKDAKRPSDLHILTVPTQSLENIPSTETVMISKSISQNIRTSQNTKNMTNKSFNDTNNIDTAKTPLNVMSVKLKVPSSSSETSRLSAHSEISLNVEEVTSEQLQALEDIQKMIFPENMTISEDGTMFGNLNQSSTLSLINTMKEAVTNSTVRRIVLLLVNNLKENTPEDTRRQLIEALLRMPIHYSQSVTQEESVMAMLQNRRQSDEPSFSLGKSTPVDHAEHKKSLSKNTNLQIPTKTAQKKQPYTEANRSTTQSPFRTRTRKTTQITTLTPETTMTTLTTTPGRSKSRRPVKLRTTTVSPSTTVSTIGRSSSREREVEDLATENDSLPQSDTRAVDLLRSLYSLASRWG